MARKLIEKLWALDIKMLEWAIRLTKGLNLLNELVMLDYMDKVNKLSVEF